VTEREGEAVITDIKAFGKPKTELFGEISVNPMENITLSMDYYLGTGRYTHFNGSTIKMDNINELNMKGTYQLNDTFGAYIKFNNLLFQKYELVYGYPQQGFNAMIGINLNF
jgi:outer membrane cobalamin receptor